MSSDVKSGARAAKDVYLKFMSLWDTQAPDGAISFDEFCDFYRDLSAACDSDEAFAASMQAAWKL